MTTGDLLQAWREATRAAELADELAAQALEAVTRADLNATAAEEVAAMAERAAESAHRAAERARSTADQAREVARQGHDQELPDAKAEQAATHVAEAEARGAYQTADADNPARNNGSPPSN